MKKIFYVFLCLLAMPLLFSKYVTPSHMSDNDKRIIVDTVSRSSPNALYVSTSLFNYEEDSCIVFSLDDFGVVSAWKNNGFHLFSFTPDEQITKIYRHGGKDGVLIHFTYYDFTLHARVIHPALSDNMAITVAFYAWQHGYKYEFDSQRHLHLLHLVKI